MNSDQYISLKTYQTFLLTYFRPIFISSFYAYRKSANVRFVSKIILQISIAHGHLSLFLQIRTYPQHLDDPEKCSDLARASTIYQFRVGGDPLTDARSSDC